jgi:hypothetical protein
VAEADSSTCVSAEFSPKWRTRFSHLRGESYNHAVVQILIVMLVVRTGAVDACGNGRNFSFIWSIFKFAVATESVMALLAMRRVNCMT